MAGCWAIVWRRLVAFVQPLSSKARAAPLHDSSCGRGASRAPRCRSFPAGDAGTRTSRAPAGHQQAAGTARLRARLRTAVPPSESRRSKPCFRAAMLRNGTVPASRPCIEYIRGGCRVEGFRRPPHGAGEAGRVAGRGPVRDRCVRHQKRACAAPLAPAAVCATRPPRSHRRWRHHQSTPAVAPRRRRGALSVLRRLRNGGGAVGRRIGWVVKLHGGITLPRALGNC
jgi:hypothetical protein